MTESPSKKQKTEPEILGAIPESITQHIQQAADIDRKEENAFLAFLQSKGIRDIATAIRFLKFVADEVVPNSTCKIYDSLNFLNSCDDFTRIYQLGQMFRGLTDFQDVPIMQLTKIGVQEMDWLKDELDPQEIEDLESLKQNLPCTHLNIDIKAIQENDWKKNPHNDSYIKSFILDCEVLPAELPEELRTKILKEVQILNFAFRSHIDSKRDLFCAWKQIESLKEFADDEINLRAGLRKIINSRQMPDDAPHDFMTNYLYNWMDRCLTFSESKSNALERPNDHLEVWWDINLLGMLIDACFYDVYDKIYLHRREKRPEATSKEGKRKKGIDLIAQFCVMDFTWEIAISEGAKSNSREHVREDRLKIAKQLKDFLDALVHDGGILEALKMVQLIGIQTQGPIVSIYRLDRPYFEAYRFYEISRHVIPQRISTYDDVIAVLDVAFAIWALKDTFMQNFQLIKDAEQKREINKQNIAQKMKSSWNLPTSITPTKPKSTQRGGSPNRSNENDPFLEETVPETNSVYIDSIESQYRVESNVVQRGNSAMSYGNRIDDNLAVAIKQCKDIYMGATELRILTVLNAKKVIGVPNLIDTFVTSEKQRVLVFPKWEELNAKTDKFSLKAIKEMMIHLFQTLSSVHESGIVHCDIREDNLMWNSTDVSQRRLCLIDFGLARFVQKDTPYPCCGSDGYMAPEMTDSKATGTACDLFSVGIVFGILLRSHLNVPSLQRFGNKFLKCTEVERTRLQLIEVRDKESGNMKHAMDLLTSMLDPDPEKRITSQSACSHPFFSTDEIQLGKLSPKKKRHSEMCNKENIAPLNHQILQ